MNRLKPMAIAIGISLLALVGCTTTKDAAVQPTLEATPAANVAVSSPTASTTGNDSLLAVVSNTKTAVSAGNFVQAQKEFDQFEDVWENVEDGIKAKSRDKYETIEKSMDEIEGELKASQPQKDKLLALLQSLETNIKTVSKT
jgi:septal ring factor EnvC (AmiA/AmiB activator)